MMRIIVSDYNLNPEQKKAVEHTDGPLLVIAGAGAGKTRVIAHRIRHLIQHGVAPESILAVTFTNKAARELRDRVLELLSKDPDLQRPLSFSAQPFISTFHALGVHILRAHARTLGIPQRFAIYDRGDSLRTVREAMKKVGIDAGQFEPRKILSAISRQKGEGKSCEDYALETEGEYYPQLVVDVWREYDAALKNDKALDFDDLLLKTVSLLETNEVVRTQYQNIWRYILIDEYQDTNRIQNKLAALLAREHNNICVVGDIDQTIYTWRGATIHNLLSFEKTYKDATVVTLEENYRSTKTIIAASNDIIAKNVNRPEKNLYTKNQDGELITVYTAYDENDEAGYVAQRAKEMIASGIEPREIAVLYRANFQSRVLEEFFLEESIPYQILGTRFFERKEVKDVLAFLRAALDQENIADIKRVTNVPPRGIGKVTLMRMVTGKEHECTPAVLHKIKTFRKLLSDVHKRAVSKKPSDTIRFIVEASGLQEHLKNGNEEALERLENIQELVSLSRKYDRYPPLDGITELLTDAALASDQDDLIEDKNGVKLMTVHASKGLEFDYVFITGLEDGLFPHEMVDALSKHSTGRDEEEERRLFYVALTRARKKLFLTYTTMRTIFGARRVNVPSEFITDIDEVYLAPENDSRGQREKIIYLDLDS